LLVTAHRLPFAFSSWPGLTHDCPVREMLA
jgi:hypothetical protein